MQKGRRRKKKLESALWLKGQVRFRSRKIARKKNQVNWKRVVRLVSVQLIVGLSILPFFAVLFAILSVA